jgi:ubiquinone/menaquinone biosynthesis C-methylase UbiE
MKQEEVWDNIASEWDEYKKIPSQLSEEFLKKAKGNVLDLGSGSGRHLTKIKNGKMFLVDFSQEMLNFAEKKAKKNKMQIETKKGDLFKIPYEDNFFDNAICISALHCIKGKTNRKKSVQELYRVMKPKSKALIGVWNFNSKRFNQKQGKEKLIKWTDKGERYYYLFEEKEVHKLFKDIGFKILSSHNSEMMINFIVEK